MLCPVLVGREDELAALRAALDAAAAGAGSLVIVVGEGGVGKSRLAREARSIAAEAGATVLAGRAVPGPAPVPYRPIAEAIQSGFRTAAPPVGPELEPFLPALARLAPLWPAAEPAESGALVVAEGVTRLLATAGRARGCLLVLEDLHWADPETLEVVSYLGDHVAAHPVACVATVRTGEASDAERLAELLSDRRAATVVRLSELPASGVDRMVAACLGTDEPPEGLREFVRSRSEGLPLLVEELLAGLEGADALVRSERGWQVVSRLVPTVPLTFAETVRSRLRALGPDGPAVLRPAAVLGRSFDWTLLPAVSGLDRGAVLAVLRRASDLQLLQADAGSDGFRFRHALGRDVVVHELLPPERSTLAAALLDAMRAADPSLPGGACELAADLAEQAGARGEAVELLVEVARRALDTGAVASARAALDRAREAAGDDRSLVAAVDEVAARAAALAGDVAGAVELGRAALSALRGDDRSRARRAQLHLALARAAITAGEWAVAGDHVASAERVATELADEEARLTATALGAQVAIGEGRDADAEHLASVVVDAGDAAPPEAVCEGLEVLGRAARLRDLAAAERHFERARDVAERHGLALWRARALHELGTIDLLGGPRPDRLLDARRAAVEAGAVSTVALVDLHICAVAIVQMDTATSIEAGQRCVELSRRLGLATLPMGLVHLATTYGFAGRREDMEAAIAEALEVGGDELEVRVGVSGRARMAYELRRGDVEAATRMLDEAMALIAERPDEWFPFRAFWAVLRTCEGRDDAEARRLAREGPGSDLPFVRAGLLLADGVAAGRAGRAGEAAAAVAQGRALGRGYGSDWWFATMSTVVAQCALADGWGDPAEWLRDAIAVFEGHGMVELASRARAALRAAGAPVPRRGRGDSEVPRELRAHGVTSREVDVLRLLAEGLGNREIGERLHLSPRTVERHVANLLVKTGLGDRHDLSGLARASGLTG